MAAAGEPDGAVGDCSGEDGEDAEGQAGHQPIGAGHPVVESAEDHGDRATGQGSAHDGRSVIEDGQGEPGPVEAGVVEQGQQEDEHGERLEVG
jgi:hypothetical protein